MNFFKRKTKDKFTKVDEFYQTCNLFSNIPLRHLYIIEKRYRVSVSYDKYTSLLIRLVLNQDRLNNLTSDTFFQTFAGHIKFSDYAS